MIHLKQALVVEGKYDKIKLSSLVDGTIVITDGFSVFHDREKQALLRLLAERVGLVVLTDSDVAGFRIRRFLGGLVGKERIVNAYIPDVFGKERRKDRPSAEGKLGVEGMTKEVLLQALERAGVLAQDEPDAAPQARITKQDLILDGLSGGPNSSARRMELLRQLDLPEHLTTNALLDVLNTVMSRDQYKQQLKSLDR